MTIAQALKEKNKKLSVLTKLWDRLASCNSIPEGNTREFNPDDILAQIRVETDALIALKTKVHLACEPVRSKIFRLSELKHYIKRLKSIDTKNGVFVSRYESVGMRYEAHFGASAIDEMIVGLETELEQLQEVLDQFNHITYL